MNIYWLAENAGTSLEQLKTALSEKPGAKSCARQKYSVVWW